MLMSRADGFLGASSPDDDVEIAALGRRGARLTIGLSGILSSAQSSTSSSDCTHPDAALPESESSTSAASWPETLWEADMVE